MNVHPNCGKTDAVLAYHLDGDLDDVGLREGGLHDAGYGFASGKSLHDHLRECGSCQRALQRARRLDAALATAAGVNVARHPEQTASTWTATTARWLQGAMAAAPTAAANVGADATREVAPPSPKVGPWPWLAVAAATGLAAFTVWPRPAAPSLAPASPAVALVTTSPLVSPRTSPPSNPPGEPTQAPVAAEPRKLPIPTVVPGRAKPATPPNTAVALQPRQLAACVADANAAPADRLAATRMLVLACRSQSATPTRALRELVPVLAALGDRGPLARDLHARQLDLVRAHDDVVTLLQSTVALLASSSRRLVRDELAVLTVAARLGRPELDRALRRVLRQEPDAIAAVAAALRCGVRPDGGARLLLDVWHETAARHPGATDDGTAMAWFRHQPATFVAELAAALRQERNAEARIRCLLALGGTDDPAAAPILFAALHDRHHDEAIAAAFALAHLPHAALEALARQHGTDAEPLLRAALAQAGVPLAQPWLDALEFDERTRQRLHHGDRATFGELAGWFRDRAGFGD